ncbi:PREDICTED: transcription factor BIM2 [Fragaria vesca subsp. vesca]|uniref:transcription factor BIM2 n=1 Tax=Fragaria vesca subsp. vesca TaxID=101020 RepID=UPI0002C2EE56|nr:PREDICTED: transcription factor BIM2 [Fragaria vesca subsp. vesca]
MAKASKGNHDEFEDDDEENHAGRGEGQGREKNRLKHSETEQRRRSKINERFQKLREIIPENDQKRDKASFLLEVIEYIQFLHEKINLYEGSYQKWSPEPTKLTPWKSHHNRLGENFADHSQGMNNGSGQENNVVVSPAMLTNAQNSVESDLDSAAVYKALDHIRGLATPSIPNMNQQNIFDTIESFGAPTQPLQESNSDAENTASQSQYQLWPGITSTMVTDSKLNRQDESKTVSISSAYSQGVLNNLTLSLRSSGVDLSQASINVELDVGNRAGGGLKSMASSSQAHLRQCLNNQMMTHSQVSSYNENFEQAHKRFRTGES